MPVLLMAVILNLIFSAGGLIEGGPWWTPLIPALDVMVLLIAVLVLSRVTSAPRV